MKHSSLKRIGSVSLFIIVLSVFASSASFGAESNYYLKFRSSTGKTYKAKPDASGKFSFTGVQPGTYTLILAGSDEYFAARKKNADDKHKDWIELQSFSWGASNTISSSAGSTGNSASATAGTGVVVTKTQDAGSPNGVVHDMNNDGRNDLAVQNIISSPRTVSVSNPVKDGSTYYVILMQNVIITSTCSVNGVLNGIAIKEPGVK